MTVIKKYKGASRVIPFEKYVPVPGLQSNADEPPTIELVGPSTIIVDLINTDPTLWILGDNPQTVYTNKGKLFFHVLEFDDLTPETASLLSDTSNVRFRAEGDLEDFITDYGVVLQRVNSVRIPSSHDLGIEYATQDVRVYEVTHQGVTGTLRVFGIIEKPWEEQGAEAYSFTGQSLPVVVDHNVVNESGNYLETYSVGDVVKTRIVNILDDPRIRVKIVVDLGLALFRLDGSMTATFPPGIAPEDYTLLWEQLPTDEVSDPVVITGADQVTMTFVGTDFLAKRFRLWINKDTSNEQFIDQSLYHSPYEVASVSILNRVDTVDQIVYDYKIVASWIGLGLDGVETPQDTEFNKEPVLDETTVIVTTISDDITKTITKTEVIKGGNVVLEFGHFVKEIYGFTYDEPLTIRYTGIYYGRLIEFLVHVGVEEALVGLADKANLPELINRVTSQSEVVQSTYKIVVVDEAISVDPFISSVLSSRVTVLSTYREIPYVETTSVPPLLIVIPDYINTVAQQTNINVG